MAFRLDFTAFRMAPWGGDTDEAVLERGGVDWSGATFKWVFSDGEGGTNKITLNNAAAGSEGVSATYDAGYLHPRSGVAVGATIILPQINQATLDALFTVDTADVVLYHTLYVDPLDGLERSVCYGNLTIKPGAGE